MKNQTKNQLTILLIGVLFLMIIALSLTERIYDKDFKEGHEESYPKLKALEWDDWSYGEIVETGEIKKFKYKIESDIIFGHIDDAKAFFWIKNIDDLTNTEFVINCKSNVENKFTFEYEDYEMSYEINKLCDNLRRKE